MTIAHWFVNLALAYAAIGFVFAVAFAISGAGKVDPSAKGSPIGFRLLIIPGAAALWPLLLKRWISGSAHPPIENNSHRKLAGEMKQ